MLISNILNNFPPLYIIDIGASGGIHPRWKVFDPNFIAVLFEPDPREFDNLKNYYINKYNYIVLNSALSDSVGEIEFYQCRKQQVSSVYRPNYKLLKKFSDAERLEVVSRLKISVDTLDRQLKKNEINDVAFIKIDTQGHEFSILKGASDVLENVIGLELEVEFMPIYENQPLFRDIDEFVTGFGFEIFDIKRCFWKRKSSKNYGVRKGQLIWGDALYFRSPENICSVSNITEEKILHAICVYLAYGYADLAEVLCDLAYERRQLSEKICESIKLLLEKYSLQNTPENDGWYFDRDRLLGNENFE
jgi:FkbM family methyltransferase